MNTLKSENYLHDVFRTLYANGTVIKRVFLVFVVITLMLPLLLKQSWFITAEVMVQSKKLAQADGATSSLLRETDKFLPPTLADMETESSILRSPTMIRAAVSKMLEEGYFHETEASLVQRYITQPLNSYVIDPIDQHLIQPVREAFGLESAPVRDTSLEDLTFAVIEDMEISALPGTNIISVLYKASDPAVGTALVNHLLDAYLANRHQLHSNDLPEGFYEQKKQQYQDRLSDLEARRNVLLEKTGAANPDEEITFRLNAINLEEQALNQYRDRELESRRWLDYLESSLAMARKTKLTDYSFPFTFASTIDKVSVEDREIRQLGDRLIDQVGQYGLDNDVYRADSVPMQIQFAQIKRTRDQFLKVVSNRIAERKKDLDILSGVIAQKAQRITDYKARVHQLQEVQSEARQLNTEIEALHQAFFTYTQRYEESRSSGLLDGALSNAKVLSRPVEPTEASFPKPMLIIPLGVLTAMLLAIAIAYVREFFDHRFKHIAQIQQQLSLPVLMTINVEMPALPAPQKPGRLSWIRRSASN